MTLNYVKLETVASFPETLTVIFVILRKPTLKLNPAPTPVVWNYIHTGFLNCVS